MKIPLTLPSPPAGGEGKRRKREGKRRKDEDNIN
jgi:hypothetical protein